MRCGPLLQVIRGAVTTSLSQAVVLSTDVVAKWEAKECILCQPGPLYDDAHAPTNNHASSFTGAALGANPVGKNIRPRRLPQSVTTTLRDL